MNCNDFELMLADALGGELTAADRPAFEQHLARCRSCRADYESAQATIARLRSLPAMDAQPASLNLERAAHGEDLSPATLPAVPVGADLPRAPRTGAPPFRGAGPISDAHQGPPQVVTMPSPRRSFALLRYAASVVIAFTAGYLANGMRADQNAAQTPVRPPIIGSTADVQLADASFGAAFAETYQRRPNSSELSRCLSTIFRK